MATGLNFQIAEIFGDSAVASVSFKFYYHQLYVDQTTPMFLLTRFKNQQGMPVSNFDSGICKSIYVFHNGYRLPQPLQMPYLGQMKFLVTPVETNVFLVKYESFQYYETVVAKTAWGSSKDFQATGTVCQALTTCWAFLKNPIAQNEKLGFKCNKECQFGVASDVGIVCLCYDTKCHLVLTGNILRWSTTLLDGEYTINGNLNDVRLCVKMKKDRVVEVYNK